MENNELYKKIEELIDSPEAKLLGAMLAIKVNHQALELAGDLGTTVTINCAIQLVENLVKSAPDEWGQELIRTRILEALAPK